jgi:hypothetical protein
MKCRPQITRPGWNNPNEANEMGRLKSGDINIALLSPGLWIDLGQIDTRIIANRWTEDFNMNTLQQVNLKAVPLIA